MVGSVSGSQAYAASKKAVTTWATGLRAELYRENILVNRVEPGFVSTPMVAASTKDAFLPVDVKEAARIVKTGLANDLPVIAFPSTMFAIASVFYGIADGVRDTIARTGLVRNIGYKPKRSGKRKGGESAADKKSD